MPKEITDIVDIQLLVDSFYEKVRADDLLGPIFNEVIGDRWSEHMPKMYRFWQTVLLNEHTYLGSPFIPHAKLPVDQTHFDRWLELFRTTLDEHFEGRKAQEARHRAETMATMFLHKINYYQKRPGGPLI